MFKIKKTVVDITIDLTEIIGKEEGILKPIKEPTAEKIIEWSKEVAKVSEEITGQTQDQNLEGEVQAPIKFDPEKSTRKMIINVDYWYGKGEEFWLKQVPFPVLQEIQLHLNNQFFRIKKK